MKYSADIQVGYYEDDGTYHGPFHSQGSFDAASIEQAIAEANAICRETMAALLDPMPEGRVLRIHDHSGHLVYDHAIGVVKSILVAPEPPSELVQLTPRLTAHILAHLKLKPEELHALRPRQFEELIAEFLASFGWDVDLTPPTRDGGYDIFAVSKDLSGIRTSWIIECKKYRNDRKVDVRIVRALWGAAASLKKSNVAIMLATTSRFTTGARMYASEKYNFELRDYERILEWINLYQLHPSGRLYLDGKRLGAFGTNRTTNQSLERARCARRLA